MKKYPTFILITIILIACSNSVEPDKVIIYNVVDSPTDSEEITLKNKSINSIEISNWTLGDKNHPTDYKIPNDTLLDADEEKTFTHSTIGFVIDDEDETIYLKDKEGKTIDTWSN